MDVREDGKQTGGGKRKRTEETAAVAVPPHHIAAPAPPPPPPLLHVDTKWVEGQGVQCTCSARKPGSTGRRCSSAAVHGHTLCAHHVALRKAAL